MTANYCKETLKSEIVEYIVSRLPSFSLESDCDASFSRLGLDSADHVHLSTIIEDHLQIEVDPALAFNYPTMNSLFSHIESLRMTHAPELDEVV